MDNILFLSVLLIGMIWWPMSLLFVKTKSRATRALGVSFIIQLLANVIWVGLTVYFKSTSAEFATANQILIAVISLVDIVIFIINTVLFFVASLISKSSGQSES